MAMKSHVLGSFVLSIQLMIIVLVRVNKADCSVASMPKPDRQSVWKRLTYLEYSLVSFIQSSVLISIPGISLTN